MELFFEFEPLKSLSGVALTDITPTNALTIFGDPTEIEKAEGGNFGEPSFTYVYHDAQLTLFFDVERLLCFATTNPSFKLFGEHVCTLREEEIIYLFKLNKFPNHVLDKDWGEKQLVFEEAGVTVFFDNQMVSEIFFDV